MIVPTAVIEYADGEKSVFNLSQFVRCDSDDISVVVTFADGSKYEFFGDQKEQMLGAIRYLHNTYQENARMYEAAKQQAASQIVTAQGMKIQ